MKRIIEIFQHASLAARFSLCCFGCCGKKEDEAEADGKKHEENIVTLTKENLEHVADQRPNRSALGSIETTLKGSRARDAKIRTRRPK